MNANTLKRNIVDREVKKYRQKMAIRHNERFIGSFDFNEVDKV